MKNREFDRAGGQTDAAGSWDHPTPHSALLIAFAPGKRLVVRDDHELEVFLGARREWGARMGRAACCAHGASARPACLVLARLHDAAQGIRQARAVLWGRGGGAFDVGECACMRTRTRCSCKRATRVAEGSSWRRSPASRLVVGSSSARMPHLEGCKRRGSGVQHVVRQRDLRTNVRAAQRRAPLSPPPRCSLEAKALC